MNRENMIHWIETLESGKYPQAFGALRSATGFCCLGVLCDINSTSWKVDEDDDFFYTEEGNLFYSIPGQTIIKTLGLMTEPDISRDLLSEEQKSRLKGDHPYCGVAELNDHGFSFKEIATLLRAEYL